MENNAAMKKRLHSNSDMDETNRPTTKKQKVEQVASSSIDVLPDEIKEKIVGYMDIKTLARIGMTNKFFKKSVEHHLYRHYKRSIINPMKNIHKAVDLFIDIWLYGAIDLVKIDDDNFTLKVTHGISNTILFDNISYNDQEIFNYYGTILNAITNELPIKNQFFWEELLIRIKQGHRDINTRGPEGQTLLYFVCDVMDGIDKDTLACIELLIENGADIFNKNEEEISPLRQLIDRLIYHFSESNSELTQETTFPVSLVELLLEKFDNAKVIKELVYFDQYSFAETAEPLFEVYLFLYNHPDADIRNLFHAEVEKSRHKEDFIKLFNKNNLIKKI